MPTSIESFRQYTGGVGDISYQFAFTGRVTIATLQTQTIIFPPQTNVIRIRSFTIEDVTVLLGGTLPSTGIACYVRIDGRPASAGVLADGSASRIVRAGGANLTRQISRFVSSEGGLSIFNPNTATVTLDMELFA